LAAGVGEAVSPTALQSEELIAVLGQLFNHVKAHIERVVAPYDLPPPCAKALHLIDGSMSMKELGNRLACDGSFVTSIADTLEGHDLARREIDGEDRRIKNLVLTEKGLELRARLVRDLFSDDFPGVRQLDAHERETLLALMRKMVAGEDRAAGG
jgi:MarR family transcriptional regulator, organic hydroperoxide resistance regulator